MIKHADGLQSRVEWLEQQDMAIIHETLLGPSQTCPLAKLKHNFPTAAI